MPQSSTWRCRNCRAPLGTVRDGTLAPAAQVVRIEPDGAAHVRCPACGAERPWKPKALRDQDTTLDPIHRPPRKVPH